MLIPGKSFQKVIIVHYTKLFDRILVFQLLDRKIPIPKKYSKVLTNQRTDLPTQAQFYDDLNDEPLSDEDYAHVTNVWNEFDLQNLGDLHDL